MSKLNYSGWAPAVIQVLMGGVIVLQILAIGWADGPQSKSRGTGNTRRNEHVARVEKAPSAQPKVAHQPQTHTNMNRPSSTAQRTPTAERGGMPPRFQPSFRPAPSKVKLQPARVDAPQAATKLPSGAIQLEGRPSRDLRATPHRDQPQPKVSAPPQSIAYLAEKGGHGTGGSQKPQIEKPVRVQETTKAPQIKPQIGTKLPSQLNPQVQVKINDLRPQSGRPGDSKGFQANHKIQIKQPHESGHEAQTTDSKGSKIRVHTIRPDLNTQTSANSASKTPREKPARLKDGETLTRDHHEQIRVHLDKQHRDLVAQGKATNRDKIVLRNHVKQEGHDRLQKLPHEALKLPVAKNGKMDPHLVDKFKIRPAHEILEGRRKNGDFQQFAKLHSGKTLHLDRQFQFHRQGDISRRMNLVAGLQQRGGWRHRFFGPISPIYARHCRSMWYAGPSFCSPYVWYPNWSPWVDWCWWDTCAPIYDPRPNYCQPIVYQACVVPWVATQFPTWQPLPYLPCGSWVDVSPVVINTGSDVQLLATRFVDPGHPEQELGPRFRVWLRNNSPVDLNHGFNVLLLASTDADTFVGLPEAGVRVASIRAGETQSVDIRLPYAANTLGRDTAGNAVPFTHLNVLVDSHNEIPEAFEDNNGAMLVRGDILPVDPAAFAADPGTSQPGGIIHVAGEGLGPEAGQAMVVIGEQEFQAEILGWFDLGVQIRLPDFDLEQPTAADLIIIRGDGAASNPLTIEIDPEPSAPVNSPQGLPEPPIPGPAID